eukprot:CAMPEP_0119128056 /NCGR_PEP_ID=MMETSP1310-20130426/6362_1 /TAXON_ID=464262 /ORGANISM="Genus nov. species nov., Strain RCC2339" /LENGTH=155 /DNA_ID=CAMNT_0007118363 /DNA_START=108 /DNA_END=575 /DNA_ORIENTATION=+
MAEFLALEWPEPGKACWDILECEPCCGEPCNPADGAYCCVCWYCCGWGSFAKLYATSLDQDDCALVNHCLILCCNVCCIFNIITRHNLRQKLGVKPDPDDVMGWVGDAVMSICCGCCTGCQQIRSVPKEGWDWYKQVVEEGKFEVMIDPIKIVRD